MYVTKSCSINWQNQSYQRINLKEEQKSVMVLISGDKTGTISKHHGKETIKMQKRLPNIKKKKNSQK